MTWDEFNEKFDKIAKTSERPDIMRLILDEFGEWEHLAFGILEMILYDRMKYGSICHSYGDKEAGHRVADAQLISRRIEELKKEFRQ